MVWMEEIIKKYLRVKKHQHNAQEKIHRSY